MGSQARPGLCTNAADLEDVARGIVDAGIFAFDIEFLSADRYIPELCLVQVAWPDAEPVAIDPFEVDPGPVLELIADPAITCVGHSARQDLQLLAERHRCRASAFIDTQIAAAFCGLGDQIGLARLVATLVGVELDKGSQFTDWSKRPLSDRQLAYALDDVRHLLVVWNKLAATLDELGRRPWVEAESASLAEKCFEILPPEEVYLGVSGASTLRGAALGALRALAAWRERTAREENKPLGWLIPDKAMVEAARKKVRDPSDLKRLRGVGPGTVRRYGEQIVEALQRGARDKLDGGRSKAALESKDQLVAAAANAVVQAECRRRQLAPHFVAARGDVEDAVRWFAQGASLESIDEVRLLTGWRRELLGDAILAWLRGERSVSVDPEHGLRLAGPPQP